MSTLAKNFNQFFPNREIGELIASYLVIDEWQSHNPSTTTADPLEKYMGSALQIISIRQMTMKDDVHKMNKKLKKLLFFDVDDYNNDDILVDEDFVVAKVRFYACINDLLVFHGFSGDNGLGVLCALETKPRVITDFHESLRKPWKKCPVEFYAMAKLFIDWYNNCCDTMNCNFFVLPSAKTNMSVDNKSSI
jgi:hypothetical protein